MLAHRASDLVRLEFVLLLQEDKMRSIAFPGIPLLGIVTRDLPCDQNWETGSANLDVWKN